MVTLVGLWSSIGELLGRLHFFPYNLRLEFVGFYSSIGKFVYALIQVGKILPSKHLKLGQMAFYWKPIVARDWMFAG